MLENKTILITGSSRGIGAAIARKAALYGAKVIVHGKTRSRALLKIAAELNAKSVVFDVVDEKAVQKAVLGLGTIDIVVNNAGVNPSKTFMELTAKDWREVFDTNVFGIVHVSKAVMRSMIKRKSGTIINIASIKGLNSISGKPAYAASKAAVMRLTSSMAAELAPHKIRVNAVAPGFTDTDMTTKTLSPKIRAQIKKIPLQRLAKPEDIAEMVVFLGSKKAAYITGQTILVDGGYSIEG